MENGTYIRRCTRRGVTGKGAMRPISRHTNPDRLAEWGGHAKRARTTSAPAAKVATRAIAPVKSDVIHACINVGDIKRQSAASKAVGDDRAKLNRADGFGDALASDGFTRLQLELP